MSERSSGLAPPMTLRSMVLKKLRKENLRVVRARTAASDRSFYSLETDVESYLTSFDRFRTSRVSPLAMTT